MKIELNTQHASITLPNGAYITNTFDDVARLLSTVLKGSDQSTINSHSYQLNQASQRTRQTRTAGDYVDYTYDTTSQLLTHPRSAEYMRPPKKQILISSVSTPTTAWA